MNDFESYVSIISELKKVYWNLKPNTPFLLPVSKRICARTIGSDIVPEKPLYQRVEWL